MKIEINLDCIRDIVSRYEVFLKEYELKKVHDFSYDPYKDCNYVIIKRTYNQFKKYLEKYNLSKS